MGALDRLKDRCKEDVGGLKALRGSNKRAIVNKKSDTEVELTGLWELFMHFISGV